MDLKTELESLMDKCGDDLSYAIFVLGALVLSITDDDTADLAQMIFPYMERKVSEWMVNDRVQSARLN